MSSTEIARPASSLSGDQLSGAALTFAAITLGWLPAIFLGDAAAEAVGGGIPSALLVTVVAYLALVAAARMAARRI